MYAYDGANLLEEVDLSGSLVARYVSEGVDEPLVVARGTATEFYQTDGLGSTTSLATTAGAVSDSFVYDSFGNMTSSTGTFTQPFRYTGREYDNETGLYFYRARYYNPLTGRFLSEDPSGFGGGDDFYVYSENNPASLVDPFGLQSSTAFNNAWSTLGDLGQWVWNVHGSRHHYDDGVTNDLRRSPAWNDIVNQVKNKHCQPTTYCGQFEFKQVFHPHNFNLTIQTVGSFCAKISFSGDAMIVDAFNEWGFQSLTRIPGTNYLSPTLQDMIFNGAKKGMPSSIFNNTHRGPMNVQRFWYHWVEKSPCCGN